MQRCPGTRRNQYTMSDNIKEVLVNSMNHQNQKTNLNQILQKTTNVRKLINDYKVTVRISI